MTNLSENAGVFLTWNQKQKNPQQICPKYVSPLARASEALAVDLRDGLNHLCSAVPESIVRNLLRFQDSKCIPVEHSKTQKWVK
ncbi:hypothetical protein [Brucella pseudogrignonensis]|uniref:hypothetical protein n=1 Tax=Brucella pseudogrignonensis TaxID=419475 RepID=UPI00124F6D10|nr:hypothetical protein [Brucella pseudogrignonensis]KAB2683818.1 hypothetical protein F9K82_23190 [Brucella pseudogrignonensis]